MRNIYDADRFIDKCFLEGLVEDYKQCYYGDCEVNLQYTEYRNDLASIERIDNSIGHIKSNCVLTKELFTKMEFTQVVFKKKNKKMYFKGFL